MKLLDTNVILRYLTEDDARKAVRCQELFGRLEKGQEVMCLSTLAVAEVIWVLLAKYRHPKAFIVEAVRRILNTPHLLVEGKELLLLALEIFEQNSFDFIDAYHVALMQARGLSQLYSYDTDFDRLPDIQRLEP